MVRSYAIDGLISGVHRFASPQTCEVVDHLGFNARTPFSRSSVSFRLPVLQLVSAFRAMAKQTTTPASPSSGDNEGIWDAVTKSKFNK